MKKQAIVCDLCDNMITTNLTHKADKCVICQRTICNGCGESFMESLFDSDDNIICERCRDAFDEFGVDDKKILEDKFSKELIEVIKKLIMTNEMRGGKQ
jgi:formylmethanofuran dehydrogenase subunit E